MRILTLEDTAFEMNELPDEVDDLRFAILDNSDPANPDYFFIPLIFLESFNSPALVLDVAGNQVKLPVDWKILIGEKDEYEALSREIFYEKMNSKKKKT